MSNPFNYSQLYKLIDNTTNKVFIGSTTLESLNRRLCEHRRRYTQYQAGKAPWTVDFEIIKNNNYRIEFIENYKCNRRKELRQRELYWIDKIECINK